MKDEILLELANRWEKQARNPQDTITIENATLEAAHNKGMRETLRSCAYTLRMLVNLLGENT